MWTSHQSQAFAKEHASKSEPKPFSAHRSAQSSWPACIRPLLAHVRSMHSSEAHRVHATHSPRHSNAKRLFSTRALVSCGGLPRPFPTLAHPSTVVLGSSTVVVSRIDGCHHGCWPSCTCSMCYKRDTRFHTPSTWSKAGAMDAHPPRPLRRTYACEGDKIRCVEPHATQPGTSKRRGGAAQADGERRTGRHAA